ncbi:MAG: alpha/beta hydrolase, partial [Pseudomonadales bacterium]
MRIQLLAVRLAARSMCLALLLLLLLTAGCSPLKALNAFEREPVVSDVGYAPGRGVTLDVFAPEESADGPAGPRSVIVFFYGGTWQDGAKEDFRFVGSQLAERGFVVVLPDYRLHPQVRFPAFVEDAADAVAWTFEHAAKHGGDPSRVFLMGHSAGA